MSCTISLQNLAGKQSCGAAVLSVVMQVCLKHQIAKWWKWLKLYKNNTYFPFYRFSGVSGVVMRIPQTSHKIWRLCWRDCCHAELVWCACASSSHVPKIALPWGSQLRWRSVLQSEAAINFYKYEDEEVKSPKSKKNVGNSSTNEQSIIISCKSILIINRVLLPA